MFNGKSTINLNMKTLCQDAYVLCLSCLKFFDLYNIDNQYDKKLSDLVLSICFHDEKPGFHAGKDNKKHKKTQKPLSRLIAFVCWVRNVTLPYFTTSLNPTPCTF